MKSLGRTMAAAAVAMSVLFLVSAGKLHAQAGDPEYVEMRLGSPDAPVEFIEYASFTCPHCANFHEGSYQRLKSDYIDTGDVRYTLREVYFDLPGLWAGIVARCGGESKYFGIVDMLFARQQDWSRQSSANEIVSSLQSIGLAAGLTSEQLNSCLTDEANAEMLFDKFKEFSENDGITSTPSFVINGERHSNMSYEELADIIEEELSS